MVETALLCLALNIFFEDRGGTLEGQKAVAQVTLNRADHAPERVCDEVFKPAQFSWANPLTLAPNQKVREARAARLMKTIEREPRAWQRAKYVAHLAIGGKMRDVVGDADHYHATYVNPRWARSMEVVVRVGGHIFYRR